MLRLNSSECLNYIKFNHNVIGQADDLIVVSDNIYKLQCLVKLINDYCHDHKVTLVPSKTKLLCFGPNKFKNFIDFCKVINPIKIGEKIIDFDSKMEHVGVLRSVAGNMEALSSRITAQKRAIGSVISIGLGKNNLSNPLARLNILKIYGESALFSGLATLILNRKEINLLNSHQNGNIRKLQKFYSGTPNSFSLLVAGSLPGEAVLHKRQLTLFGMICRLPDCNPLKMQALHISSKLTTTKHSWFYMINNLCTLYSLPSCSHLLNFALSKEKIKELIQPKILDYWQTKLRNEAKSLKSLKYFNPDFYTLHHPSLVYKMAGDSRYEVAKLNIQLTMLSGRYRTNKLKRFWSENTRGTCQLHPSCTDTEESICHILTQCPGL